VNATRPASATQLVLEPGRPSSAGRAVTVKNDSGEIRWTSGCRLPDLEWLEEKFKFGAF
jgi:hypothetical protein